MIKETKKQGVAILYAVLLTTIILSVGLILADIITKQIVLSSTGKNSQYAYYAANVGKECALYWDLYHNSFGIIYSGVGGPESIDVGNVYDGSNPEDQINCAGEQVEWDGVPTLEGDEVDIRFTLGNVANTGTCAQVQIRKTLDPTLQPETFCRDGVCNNTAIISRGYNVACNGGDLPPRAVERAVRVRL